MYALEQMSHTYYSMRTKCCFFWVCIYFLLYYYCQIHPLKVVAEALIVINIFYSDIFTKKVFN